MKADLTARLHRAIGQLRALAEDEPDRVERTRLLGKAEGVALALDYLRAYPDEERRSRFSTTSTHPSDIST